MIMTFKDAKSILSNLPGAAAPGTNTSELMRPEGQANWLVHEIAHLHTKYHLQKIFGKVFKYPKINMYLVFYLNTNF